MSWGIEWVVDTAALSYFSFHCQRWLYCERCFAAFGTIKAALLQKEHRNTSPQTRFSKTSISNTKHWVRERNYFGPRARFKEVKWNRSKSSRLNSLGPVFSTPNCSSRHLAGRSACLNRESIDQENWKLFVRLYFNGWPTVLFVEITPESTWINENDGGQLERERERDKKNQIGYYRILELSISFIYTTT